jgi:hypothetical protein
MLRLYSGFESQIQPHGMAKSPLGKLFHPVKTQPDLSALKQDPLNISFWRTFQKLKKGDFADTVVIIIRFYKEGPTNALALSVPSR